MSLVRAICKGDGFSRTDGFQGLLQSLRITHAFQMGGTGSIAGPMTGHHRVGGGEGAVLRDWDFIIAISKEHKDCSNPPEKYAVTKENGR